MFGLGNIQLPSVLDSLTLGAGSREAAEDVLPTDAELENFMFTSILSRNSVGDGCLGIGMASSGIHDTQQILQQAATLPQPPCPTFAGQPSCPQSPILARIKCPPGQTSSPPLAVGKVYRADLAHVRGLPVPSRTGSDGGDLIKAYYPAAQSPHSPLAPTAPFAAAQPGTPQFVGPPPPPPPPPRPAPQNTDDALLTSEQLYQDKLSQLDERAKLLHQSFEQLKVDRAYVMGIHAENQSTSERHAIAREELEEQANLLRRAAHQQRIKESSLEAKEAQLNDKWKALQLVMDNLRHLEAAVAQQKQELEGKIEALDLIKQVKALSECSQAKAEAVAAIETRCPACLKRALTPQETMAEHLKALVHNDNKSQRYCDGDTTDGAPSPGAVPAPRVILNSRLASGVSDGKNAHHDKKQAVPILSSKSSAVKRTGVRVSTPNKGTIKILFREKTAQTAAG